MDVKRIDEKEFKKWNLKNLKQVLDKGKFLKKSEKTFAYVFPKENPKVEVETITDDGVNYVLNKKDKELFIQPGKNAHQIYSKDIDNLGVYQVSEKGYTLIAIDGGKDSQTGIVYDPDGEIIGQVNSYRKRKNHLVGFKVETNKIILFAESISGAGESYFYKLEFPKKKSERPAWYNLSEL